MTEEKLYEDMKYSLHDLNTALVIGGYQKRESLETCIEHVEELAALALTYGFEVVGKKHCVIRSIDPALFFGKGKVEELRELAESLSVDVVIFDNEISPNQQRNLEKRFRKPVIDRTELILEIFSKRAQTKEALLQTELARSQYQLPRLKRLWTHLSRQSSGGGGFLKGEGERQIELDRRLVRKRITQLKKQIDEVHNTRSIQRHARSRSETPTFSIIGYTNVGKSTLLRCLTDADVLIEDKLFATLDTTTRKYQLPNQQDVLLIDTVGFIRKIPHTLVAAFKSTLEEAVSADILIHLIDVNHPLAEEHAISTYSVLEELQAGTKKMITVLNKVDALEDMSVIERFKGKYPHVITISALNKYGIDDLTHTMIQMLDSLRVTVSVRIPQNEYGCVSVLMDQGRIISREYEDNDVKLVVEIPKILLHKIERYLE